MSKSFRATLPDGTMMVLPIDLVQLKKSTLYGALTESKEVYVDIQEYVRQNSLNALLIEGGASLRRRIVILIWLHRVAMILCLPSLILTFLWSWLFVFGIPALWVVGLYVLSPLQIAANVELVARLQVFEELLETDGIAGPAGDGHD